MPSSIEIAALRVQRMLATYSHVTSYVGKCVDNEWCCAFSVDTEHEGYNAAYRGRPDIVSWDESFARFTLQYLRIVYRSTGRGPQGTLRRANHGRNAAMLEGD